VQTFLKMGGRGAVGTRAHPTHETNIKEKGKHKIIGVCEPSRSDQNFSHSQTSKTVKVCTK